MQFTPKMPGVPGLAGPSLQAAMPTQEDEGDFPVLLDPKRRPAFKGRVTGKVTDWKGRFGWLDPDVVMQHPEARLKGGKIYFSQEDVLEVISGVGAEVSFYVYSDGNGLGALNVVPATSLTAKKKITKVTSKPKAKAKSIPGRKRVSEEQMTGKVKSWRGGFGFLTPSSPVDHPLFTGSLFLHSNDVSEASKLKEGKQVVFYMYSDPQGLGAEECEILDDDDDAGGGAAAAPAATSAPAAADTSALGMLKAKPKGGGMMVATPKAKAGVMKATPKASAAVKASGDPELAKKMAENPELARQLSAWMFDPGG